MRRFWPILMVAAAVGGCESTPRATTAEGTAGIATLGAERDRCAALGHAQGSEAMVACMRAGEAPAP